MTSTVAWLDADDGQRRRMREAVELFRQEGAVDELGLGRMRDVISERLFPGTSVLWRRARYLLFVPWLFQLLEAGKPPGMGGASPADRAKRLQGQLARELSAWAESKDGSGIDTGGIIGRNKVDVWQTPDMNIWAGLEVWGIRVVPTTITQARREAVERSRFTTDLSAIDSPPDSIWNPRVPPMPEEFPAGASMELEAHEARFLASLLEEPDLAQDPYAERRHDSLLPVLLHAPDKQFEAAKTPLFVGLSGMNEPLANALEMAACFSQAMRAAQLLYVQAVCEARDDDQAHEVLERLKDRWADWQHQAAIDHERLVAWEKNLDRFEEMIAMGNPRIGQRDFGFVRDWANQVVSNSSGLPQSKSAKSLVINRENQVKGAKAKISISGKVGLDIGVDIPVQLTFRWEVVHNVIADIRKGLGK